MIVSTTRRLRKLGQALSLGFAVLYAIVPNAASAKNRNLYDVRWVLGEAALPAEPIWVKEQAPLLEAKLWPTALYLTDQPVIAEDGRALLPAGTQVIGLKGIFPVVCNLRKGTDKAHLNARERVCLVDKDSDGVFESWFSENSGGEWWFVLESMGLPYFNRVREVALTAIDPKQMHNPPMLRLHYQRIMDEGNSFQRALDKAFFVEETFGTRVRFHIEAGDGRFLPIFGQLCREPELTSLCASGTFPASTEILSADITILERRKEDLLIRVNSNFKPLVLRFTKMDDDTYVRTGDFFIVDEEGKESK